MRGRFLHSDQLVIANTIAPTTAIRAHSNSLSPQRFNRLRMSEPPSIITLQKGGSKADAWMGMVLFSASLGMGGSRIERFRTGRTERKRVLGHVDSPPAPR